MKLRVKLTVFTVLFITAAICICRAFAVSFCSKNVENGIVSSGISDYSLQVNSFCNAVNPPLTDTSPAAKRAFLIAIISSLQRPSEFSLQSDNDIIYNNTGMDARLVLSYRKKEYTDSRFATPISYRIIRQGNNNYFVAGNTIDIVSNEPYYFVIVRDVTDIMGTASELSVKMCAICAIVIFLSAFFMSYYIYHSLKSLKALHSGVSKISQGDYSNRLNIHGKDEISELAVGFNTMADAVERHIHTIQATSEERQMLLSALSHEMKTPVTAINACSYSLTHTKLNSEQQHEIIQFIDDECKRLERLSGKLTQLISMQNVGIMPTNISIEKFTRKLRKVLMPIASKADVTLCINFDNGENGYIYAEEDLLICLVTNLFDNCLKAGASVVRINIDKNAFSVVDNGKGIPMDEIDKVMQPFYTVNKSGRTNGFGLGLALVKRIAELHKAKLFVESKVGCGTTVTLHLNPYISITTS